MASEDTHTVAVSRAGAFIALKQQVAVDDTVRIINQKNHSEADFRIVGPTCLNGTQVIEWGVECAEAGRNIWDLDLPQAAPDSESSEANALLQCRACGNQGSWPVTLMEAEVLSATGVIIRACDKCAKPTYWIYAQAELRPRQFEPSEAVAPPPREAEVKKTIYTRADKRVAIKLPVLVRNGKGEEEASQTENVSKGGIAVYLAMPLEVGEPLVTICPYTAGGQNIEQKADVRWRSKFSFGERWLYGLRYLR